MSERAAPMALDEWRKKAADGEAPTDVILHKHFIPDSVKAAKDSRQITFVISTGAVDRENDTIAVEGWDVSGFLKNPVVMWAHRYDQLPVARALSVTKTAGQLKATAEFPEPGLYPLADTVYEMLKGGFLRATSVGFRPIKAVPNEERPGFATDFLEQELLEFSVVPIPCNAEALMEAAKGFTGALMAGIDVTPLERALALAKSVVPVPPEQKDIRTENIADPPLVIEPSDTVAKSGRTFSAANEARIRGAHDYCSKAVSHMQELLDQVAMPDMPDEPAECAAAPIEKAPESPIDPSAATEVAAAPPVYVLDHKELVASFQAAVSAAVTASARPALN